MFSVYTRIGDGELIFVATRDQLEQAIRLASDLNTSWPREYMIQDSDGNKVDLNGYAAIHLNPVKGAPSASRFQ